MAAFTGHALNVITTNEDDAIVEGHVLLAVACGAVIDQALGFIDFCRSVGVVAERAVKIGMSTAGAQFGPAGHLSSLYSVPSVRACAGEWRLLHP